MNIITMKNKISVLVILSLSSCASNPPGEWFKLGGHSPEEFNKARYHCLKESQQPKSSFASMWPSSNNPIPRPEPVGPAQKESAALLRGLEHGLQSHHSEDSGMVTNKMLFDACMNAEGFFWRLN